MSVTQTATDTLTANTPSMHDAAADLDLETYFLFFFLFLHDNFVYHLWAKIAFSETNDFFPKKYVFFKIIDLFFSFLKGSNKALKKIMCKNNLNCKNFWTNHAILKFLEILKLHYIPDKVYIMSEEKTKTVWA